jgi:hypothetical protein
LEEGWIVPVVGRPGRSADHGRSTAVGIGERSERIPALSAHQSCPRRRRTGSVRLPEHHGRHAAYRRQGRLGLVDAEGTLYANIGSGRFWLAAAESYGPLLARSGLLTHDIADEWRDFQVRSAGDNTFFGASNYYTYLKRRSEPGQA